MIISLVLWRRRTKSLASENEHRFSLRLGHAAAGKQCCALLGEALVFFGAGYLCQNGDRNIHRRRVLNEVLGSCCDPAQREQGESL